MAAKGLMELKTQRWSSTPKANTSQHHVQYINASKYMLRDHCYHLSDINFFVSELVITLPLYSFINNPNLKDM